MEGFIQLHRKIMCWDWYDDLNTFKLFIHCLLKANHKDKTWRGILIKRGSFITSNEKLSNETGLSIMQVRTSLKKLEKTNEVNKQTTNLNTCISMVNYNNYQSSNKQITNKQQTNNNQVTTTNNDNNDNNEKKRKYNFKLSLLNYGFNGSLVNDWLLVRKNKKASNTETAFKGFIKKVESSGLDKNELLKICVEKSWASFNKDWIPKTKVGKTRKIFL